MMRREAARLLADAYETEQGDLRRAGLLPSSRPARHDTVMSALSVLGSVSIGVFLACFVVFAVFIVLNVILHFQV